MPKGTKSFRTLARRSRATLPSFDAAAQALCHKVVRAALKRYTLEPDFEVYVADPDDPNEVNYCEEFLGVNKKKRKAKPEIVDNLDEALKDPSSVRGSQILVSRQVHEAG